MTPAPPHGCGLVGTSAAQGWLVREHRLRPGYVMAGHGHTSDGVAVTVTGEWRAELHDELVHVPAGEALVLPAGVEHRESVGAAGALVLLVCRDDHAPDAIPGDHALGTPRHLRGPEVALLGRSLLATLAARDPWSALLVEDLLLGALRRPAPLWRSDRGVPAWIQRVRQRIREELPARPTLAELARDAGVTREHLARTFRRVERRSVGGYVRAVRLDRALRDLRETRDPVTTIAIRCGFADHSHLTRSFRRRFGMTPRQFRATLRTSADGPEDAAGCEPAAAEAPPRR